MFRSYIKERIGKFIHFAEKVGTILFRPDRFARTIELGDKKSFGEALDFVFIIMSAAVLVRLVLSYLLGVEPFAGKGDKLVTLYVVPLAATMLLAAIPWITLRVLTRRRTPLTSYMHCVAYSFAVELLGTLYVSVMAVMFAARHGLNDQLIGDIKEGEFRETAPSCSEVIKQFDCLFELQQAFAGIPDWAFYAVSFLASTALASFLFWRVLKLSLTELAIAFAAYLPVGALLVVLVMFSAE